MINATANASTSTGLKLYQLVLGLLFLAAIIYFAAYEADRSDAMETGDSRINRVLAMLEQEPPTSRREALRDELVAIVLEAKEQKSGHDLLLHVAIALIVAALLVALVEIRVRKLNREEFEEYRERLTSNIWSALSGQLVPPEVVTQIHSLLRFAIIRKDCRYRFVLDPAPQLDKLDAANWILLRRRIEYRIKKLAADHTMKHVIRSQFDRLARKLDVDGREYPRFVSFSIDGNPQSLSSSADIAELEIVLGEEEVRVVIEAEELYQRNEDYVHYIMFSPACRLTVEIVNNLRSQVVIREVALTHAGAHAPGRLQPLVDATAEGWQEGTWEYSGAVLPGQGFSVAWEKTR